MMEPSNCPVTLAAITPDNVTAVKILNGAAGSSDDPQIRRRQVVVSCETQPMRIGGSDITATKGIPMAVGQSIVLSWEVGDQWYAISQTASAGTLQRTIVR
jgi:hypothetical protein